MDHSCATSTVRPVFFSTQCGRGGVTGAATAKAILPPETSLLVMPFRTVDNKDTRMQRRLARSPFSNLLRARSRCHQVTPSTTARFQTAPFAIITERDKELLADLRRALAMAIPRCILSRLRHCVGGKPRGSHKWPPDVGRAVPMSLPLVAG